MNVSSCFVSSWKWPTQIAFLSILVMILQVSRLIDGQQPITNGGTTLTLNENGGLSTPTSANQVEVNSGGQEEQVVAGLLQWLWNKKREKDAKKRDPIIMPYPVQPQPFPQPLPQPIPQPHLVPIPMPHRHQQPKTIHIHINNHIKKDHKKHHHKKHHSGHYEYYHDGHYDHDLNDKFYMGKFHAPLLSHHYAFDHLDLSGHHGDDHYGSDPYGSHDYHAGYESRQQLNFATGNSNQTESTTATAQLEARRQD